MQVALVPGMLQSLAARLAGPPAPRPAGAAQSAPPRMPSALDLPGAPGSASQHAFRRVGDQRAGDGQDATNMHLPQCVNAAVASAPTMQAVHGGQSSWEYPVAMHAPA